MVVFCGTFDSKYKEVVALLPRKKKLDELYEELDAGMFDGVVGLVDLCVARTFSVSENGAKSLVVELVLDD